MSLIVLDSRYHRCIQLLSVPGVEEFNMEVEVFNEAFIINVFKGTLVNNY